MYLTLRGLNEGSKADYVARLLSTPIKITSAKQVNAAMTTKAAECGAATFPKVALCAIHSAMGPFLQEWLMHHLLLGVSRVYIVSNSDPWPEYSAAALKPFVEAGLVEVVDQMNDGYPQVEFYNKCVNLAKGKYDFVGTFDVDEYFVSLKKIPNLFDDKTTSSNKSSDASSSPPDRLICINEFLETFRGFGGVTIPVRFMSSVGVPEYRPSQLMSEQFVYELKEFPVVIKSFLNPLWIENITSPHFALYRRPNFAVNLEGRRADNATYVYTNYNVSADPFEFAEFRHFWGSSFLHSVYFKLCGQSTEREQYRLSRILKFIYQLTMQLTVAAPSLPDKWTYSLRRHLEME